jgi:hypothetical protein
MIDLINGIKHNLLTHIHKDNILVKYENTILISKGYFNIINSHCPKCYFYGRKACSYIDCFSLNGKKIYILKEDSVLNMLKYFERKNIWK